MLKKRIIAVLPVYDGIVVQSVGFNKYLPVGKPEIAIEFLNTWGIDEIIINDISATRNGRVVDPQMIKKSAKKCFVPLTVGGGIRTIDDVDKLIQSGADKVCLNQSLYKNPNLISKISQNYGDQCIVASIDVLHTGISWKVFDYIKDRSTDITLEVMLQKVTELGVGEILVNSVDRDGYYTGFDIELFRKVCKLVSVPVLACGGARNPQSISELFTKTAVSAACVGNYFHFYEHSVNLSKHQLSKFESDIRMESSTKYVDTKYDIEGRLVKKTDEMLEKMLYIKVQKEII
jgi:cyclase